MMKTDFDKKLALGAICVALSGFVPQVTRQARAASASISATGSFTGGIQVTPVNNVQFGKFVATAPVGTVGVTAGGAQVEIGGFFNGGTQGNGKLSFQAGSAKNINVTVTGLKNSLTLGTVGGKATGTVNFGTISITGPFAGKLTFTPGNLTQTVNLTSTNQPVNIGAQISWGPVQPIGTFAQVARVFLTF